MNIKFSEYCGFHSSAKIFDEKIPNFVSQHGFVCHIRNTDIHATEQAHDIRINTKSFGCHCRWHRNTHNQKLHSQRIKFSYWNGACRLFVSANKIKKKTQILNTLLGTHHLRPTHTTRFIRIELLSILGEDIKYWSEYNNITTNWLVSLWVNEIVISRWPWQAKWPSNGRRWWWWKMIVENPRIEWSLDWNIHNNVSP